MIRVTSTACNPGPLVMSCVRSVAEQTYQDWRLDYFDAASTDGMCRDAAEVFGAEKRITFHYETTRTGIFDKLLPLWRSLPDDDIIVWLDGDDRLAVDQALDVVALYHDAGAQVTYGQFIWADGTPGFAAQVGNDPRTQPWTATHLKTFRAGLVKRIKDEDLRDADGQYFRYVTDQCVMLPLLEMAPERSLFINKVLHVYSGSRGTQSDADRQAEFAALKRIRALPRYARVE